eukprot:TRINITY_DN3459_c0_g1_i3.p1 TRINITY_DN3459_c0_g1~~TRINITY_DN3459_c0_g1_i3.p1  ORF type:complete len:394 (-),score=56.50 TRINITY_DN3459_c0_g1_i3:149-1330(-)
MLTQHKGVEGWELGTPSGYMKELVAYWRNSFDWRAQESLLNQMPQFVTDIDGLAVHFVHVRSKASNAIPLIFVHGWPGSFFECSKVLPLLTDENAELSFDVVCPSLPGYGFSEAPKTPGYNPTKMAEMFNKLMLKLGYSKYVAQGGDWGGMIVARLGAYHHDNCVAVHTNFAPASPPFTRGFVPFVKSVLGLLFPSWIYNARDLPFIENMLPYMLAESGYMHIQATRPWTVAYGLEDSPVGLAAYFVEKFYAWGDTHGNVESRFSKDELLTNIMIYWVSNSIASSMRLYYEHFQANIFEEAKNFYVPVPTGIAIFPAEMMRPPLMWVSYMYNVTSYTYMEKGGHFAALEEPHTLVRDVRNFLSQVPYLLQKHHWQQKTQQQQQNQHSAAKEEL